VRLEDPDSVANEYASDERLAKRIAAQRFGKGPDARELAFAAIAEARPRRVLEVGCGRGELAERIASELGAGVVAVDQSAHMVELTRARGIEAHVGDVQQFDLPDAAFDGALAAWMLYHVPDVDQALAELARVLRPGGRLVAVTNGADHTQELYSLLGLERPRTTFLAEDAPSLLARHFERVEVRDARGWIVFPSRTEAQEYVDASIVLFGHGQLPPFDGELRVRRSPVVLVADKAR
jgi:SAM-dependent methyltransferase